MGRGGDRSIPECRMEHEGNQDGDRPEQAVGAEQQQAEAHCEQQRRMTELCTMALQQGAQNEASIVQQVSEDLVLWHCTSTRIAM